MSQRRLPILCPSSGMAAGGSLLGVVREDGRVQFLRRPVPIDREFMEVARQGRNPNKRFRFSRPCATTACPYWEDGTSRCGVGDVVVDELAPTKADEPLPDCGIRASCRWFDQRGADACRVCPDIITDIFIDDEPPGSP